MNKVKAAYKRGVEDFRADRSPIFRSTKAYGLIPCSEDPLAENWSTEEREAYIKGYQSERKE